MGKSKEIWSPETAAQNRAAAQALWDDLIKIDVLARRYNVSIRTIRYWNAKGLLPPGVQAGRWKKYSLKALKEWEETGSLDTLT